MTTNVTTFLLFRKKVGMIGFAKKGYQVLLKSILNLFMCSKPESYNYIT